VFDSILLLVSESLNRELFHLVQPSRRCVDGPDQRWRTVVWQRCIGGPGSWLGSSKELASRFGEAKVGCKRYQSAECVEALTACTSERRI
jgi:hypothetical protein